MTHDTADSEIEAALGRSLSFAVPVRSRNAIERRVEAAISSESARRERQVGGRGLSMPARRILLGVAAAVLMTGTVAAGGTILSQLVGGAPLLEDMWDRSTEIGQSTTDAGYTIVLERAAADSERIWVAVTVASESGSEADLGRMQVIDANGVVFDGGTGAGATDLNGVSAMIFGFKVPNAITPHGPFTLEVTSVTTMAGETPGQWAFTFEVPLMPAASRAPANATPAAPAP